MTRGVRPTKSTLAVFLSDELQSNVCTYAWNDPLKYIDPSGHSLLGDIVGIIVAIVIVIVAPYVAGAAYGVGGASFAATAAVAGFVGGFVGAYISTGSLSAALTAGLIAGITAFAFAKIGSYAAQMAQRGSEWAKPFSVLAHAAVGCANGVASGGNCGRGALAAGISDAAVQWGLIKPDAVGTWGSVKGAAEAGLVGGVAARITGGKFDDGFTVAAAGYWFNSAAHSRQSTSEADQEIFDTSGQSLPLSPYSLEILPFATLDVGTYSVYSYQLMNVLGEPLTGSGYSLREQVEPAIGITSNADFVPMNNGVATDLVGWVPPVLAPQNFLLVTTQTFSVQVHGEIYPLTSQFQHVNQVVGGVVSNTVSVIRR